VTRRVSLLRRKPNQSAPHRRGGNDCYCLDTGREPFCISEACGDESEDAFRLLHNTDYLLDKPHHLLLNTQGDPQQPTTDTRCIVSSPRSILALTLDFKLFKDVEQGLVFGSNPDLCDILLDVINQTGICQRHFRLSWETGFPAADALIVCNESDSQEIVIERESVFKHDQPWKIRKHGNTCLSVGLHSLRSFVPKRTLREQNEFNARWLQFVDNANQAEGKLAPFTRLSFWCPTVFWELTTLDGAKTFVDVARKELMRLGTGPSCKVWKCKAKRTGELFAVKKIAMSAWEASNQMRREPLILKNLNHPNIVKYFGSAKVDGIMEIYMELAEPGDLYAYALVQRGQRLTQDITREAARQVLGGLAYLHEHVVVHRDIKPSNILVFATDPLLVKIADFGYAKNQGSESKCTVVQPFLLANL